MATNNLFSSHNVSCHNVGVEIVLVSFFSCEFYCLFTYFKQFTFSINRLSAFQLVKIFFATFLPQSWKFTILPFNNVLETFEPSFNHFSNLCQPSSLMEALLKDKICSTGNL